MYIAPTVETATESEVPSHAFPVSSSIDEPVFVWARFSSYTKLIRIVAYVLRLSPRFRHFRTTSSKIEDPAELDNAEKRLLYLSQMESFPNDISALTSNQSVKPGKLPLPSYSPFLGSDNLLRSQSRLR